MATVNYTYRDPMTAAYPRQSIVQLPGMRAPGWAGTVPCIAVVELAPC